MSSGDLQESIAHCKSVTRHHAKSFFFCSFALPPVKKDAAYAIYAFCRHADDAIDCCPDPDLLPGIIEALRLEYGRVLSGESHEAFAPALRDAVNRYGIEETHFAELIEGVAMDEQTVRIETWEELRRYCYHVASTVGLVMCPVLGLKDPAGIERAIDLGIAMQLTNILRDVGEDRRMGRIYLPAEELDRFGVEESDLDQRSISPALRELMKFQIDRARDYYFRSEPGIALLAADGSQFTTWLMRTVYGGILEEIEKIDYQVLRQRAYVRLPRKFALAGKAWLRSRG